MQVDLRGGPHDGVTFACPHEFRETELVLQRLVWSKGRYLVLQDHYTRAVPAHVYQFHETTVKEREPHEGP